MEQHHDKEIKFKLSEGKLLRTLNFKIISELCSEQCRTITINKERETIHVSKPNIVPNESPLKKIVKVTDTTNKEIDASTSSNSENEKIEMTRIDTNESSYQDIVSLLPQVMQTLKENGRKTEYVSFNRLLAEKKFQWITSPFYCF